MMIACGGGSSEYTMFTGTDQSPPERKLHYGTRLWGVYWVQLAPNHPACRYFIGRKRLIAHLARVRVTNPDVKLVERK